MTIEIILAAPLSHETEPHCCGCWVIKKNEYELFAECNECGERRDILDMLSHPADAGVNAQSERRKEDADRTVYVIEKGSPAQYFFGFNYGSGKWTPDFFSAHQFSSREAAQQMWDCDAPIFTIFNDNCRIEGHIICGGPAPHPASPHEQGETPETDAFANEGAADQSLMGIAAEWAAFARSLERRLREAAREDMVICPKCCHQFRAIPQNVQDQIISLERRLREAERDAMERAARISDHYGKTTSVLQEMKAAREIGEAIRKEAARGNV